MQEALEVQEVFGGVEAAVSTCFDGVRNQPNLAAAASC